MRNTTSTPRVSRLSYGLDALLPAGMCFVVPGQVAARTRAAQTASRTAAVALARSPKNSRSIRWAGGTRVTRTAAMALALAAATSSAQAATIDLKDPQFASIDKILVVKRTANVPGHMCDQYFGFNAPAGGGVFILENVLSGGVTERNVLANSVCANGSHQGKKLEGGSFLSPDLSYDAKQILFAYTDVKGAQFKAASAYHIFKVNVDGTGLTQLTEGDTNDFDPAWMPDGRIVFISERRGGFGRCHGRPVPTYTLFGMNADGTGIHAISLHETNEWNPSIDNNGMIVYSRWDYVDRGSAFVHHGWLTTPDGLDARAIGTNYLSSWGGGPRAFLQIRSIPNSNKYVGTAVAHHDKSYGCLFIFDPDVEDDDRMAQYTRLTPDSKMPETDEGGDLKYATPWALSEDYFLCVHDPGGKGYGVYLIDRAGNKTLLKGGDSYLEPIPLAPRPLPPIIIPSITATDLKTNVIVTVVNVYDSIYPWPANTEIKSLRIVQIYPKSTPYNNNPRLGHGAMGANDQNGRGVLGTVPVESDGSANFLMPPGKEVYFQALDANGVAIQSMMSNAYALPGSTRLTCQGCHEPRHRTAHPGKTMPIAMLRSPTVIQPEPDGSNPMNFPRLIQPILDKKCVSCHGATAPNLSKGGNGWYTSYNNLKPYITFYLSYLGIGPGFARPAQTDPVVSIPGKINGARASKLYRLLEAGHKNVVLTPQELRAFAVWLDNNSDFYGHEDNLAGQARGEVCPPALE